MVSTVSYRPRINEVDRIYTDDSFLLINNSKSRIQNRTKMRKEDALKEMVAKDVAHDLLRALKS